MDSSQHIVEGRLGEGQVLVDGIEIVRVDAGDHLVNDPIPFGVRESLALVLHDLGLLISIVVHLRAKWRFFFDLKKVRREKGGERGKDEPTNLLHPF